MVVLGRGGKGGERGRAGRREIEIFSHRDPGQELQQQEACSPQLRAAPAPTGAAGGLYLLYLGGVDANATEGGVGGNWGEAPGVVRS